MPNKFTAAESIRTNNNDFANYTMKVRLPNIIQEISTLNPDYPDSIHEQLDALQAMVANDDVIPLLDMQTAYDYDPWMKAYEEQHTLVNGDLTWHDVQWFFAETYVYRYLLEVVRWYETGRDPYLPKKRTELDGDALWKLLDCTLAVSGTVDEQLMELLAFDLWGNRIDLSYEESRAQGTDISDDDLLVDDRANLLDYLHQSATDSGSLKGKGDIYIVADNAGTELTMDLVLIDFLLQHVTEKVYLHVKAHPTFVSDTISADVWMTLDAMLQHGEKATQLSQRLIDAWNKERFHILPHPYWNSSDFIWHMPKTLSHLLNDARMVIFKGDANYRRVVGDAMWAVETSFSDILSFINAPVMCLRTLKSDTLIGLPSAETAQKLNTIDPKWRNNGKRGVIQFKDQI